jgi:hypothetical protein
MRRISLFERKGEQARRRWVSYATCTHFSDEGPSCRFLSRHRIDAPCRQAHTPLRRDRRISALSAWGNYDVDHEVCHTPRWPFNGELKPCGPTLHQALRRNNAIGKEEARSSTLAQGLPSRRSLGMSIKLMVERVSRPCQRMSGLSHWISAVTFILLSLFKVFLSRWSLFFSHFLVFQEL